MPSQTGGRHPLAFLVDHELSYGRHVIRAFLREVAPYERVLDIGAGTGVDLHCAAEVCPAAETVGVEVREEVAERLRASVSRVLVADIEADRLDLDDGSVDVVIANQVLEHTKELFWILHEVSRCLRVGGHLLIGVPNLASLHNRILMLAGTQPTQIKSASAHVRGFTRKDLVHFLGECFPGGYELRRHAGSQFYPFPGSVARRLARWLPSMAFSTFVCVEKRRPYRREFLEFPPEQALETHFYLGPE